MICRHERLKSQESNWGLNELRTFWYLSQALLPSEPLDSLMVEKCRIVLIPKLASDLAVSNYFSCFFTQLWFTIMPCWSTWSGIRRSCVLILAIIYMYIYNVHNDWNQIIILYFVGVVEVGQVMLLRALNLLYFTSTYTPWLVMFWCSFILHDYRVMMRYRQNSFLRRGKLCTCTFMKCANCFSWTCNRTNDYVL